jgi:protein N-terminal glutamine amidohydrolase
MYLEATPVSPPIPQDAIYTSCYCEENIYLLAQSFSVNPDIAGTWDIYVVFISNYNKSVGKASDTNIRDH